MTMATDRMVADYLRDLGQATADLPPQRRDELLADVHEHIAVRRAELSHDDQDNEAAVRAMLHRLGAPAQIAEQARAEAGWPPAGWGPASPVAGAPTGWPGAAGPGGWAAAGGPAGAWQPGGPTGTGPSYSAAPPNTALKISTVDMIIFPVITLGVALAIFRIGERFIDSPTGGLLLALWGIGWGLGLATPYLAASLVVRLLIRRIRNRRRR